MPQESSAASRSLTAVRRVVPAVGPATLRLALRAVPAASRTRVLPANSPAGRVPSIPLAPALPAPAQVAQAVLALVPALAPVPDSVLHAPVALVLLRVVRPPRVKLRALRVLRDHRVAVVANNTPRPRKAR